MEERDDLAAALAPIVEALERLGVVRYVGGSVARTIHGRFRAGGGVSERPWGDVLGVVQTRGAELDMDYLRAWAQPLRVAELLEDALAGRERPADRGNSAT